MDNEYYLRKRPPPPPDAKVDPRGGARRHAGRPQGSVNHSTDVAAAKRAASHQAHTPESEKKRVRSLKKNTSEAALLQAALEYKKDHNVGDRAKVIIIKEEVYLKAERRKPRNFRVEPIDHLVTPDEQFCVREWIHTHSLNREGNKVMEQIVEALNEELGKSFTERIWATILHSMNIWWGRLSPGYYRAMHFDPKIVKRRTALSPLLHELYLHPLIIVWDYDQCRPHVNDNDKYGYIDYDNDWHRFPRHIGTERQRGVSLSNGAFLSREFGLLYRDDGTHVGCSCRKKPSTADDIAGEFDEAAKLVTARWPQYVHVFFTDSPSVHSGMEEGFCNPSKINLSDGGKERGYDNLFGTKGLKKIFAEEFPDDDVTGLKVSDLRRLLWSKPRIRAQRFRLEEVVGQFGALFLFNVQGHPHLAPIERLWRSVRYDYRHCKAKNESELRGHWTGWLDDGGIDAEWVEAYYAPTMAYLKFYRFGGRRWLSEMQIMRLDREGMENPEMDVNLNLNRAVEARNKLKKAVPMLFSRGGSVDRDVLETDLREHFHTMNWKRRRDEDERSKEELDQSSAKD